MKIFLAKKVLFLTLIIASTSFITASAAESNTNTSPSTGISITPQARAQAHAATKAKVQPSTESIKQSASKTDNVDSSDKQVEPLKPVIKKIKPPVPEDKPLRTVWPQNFYYYSFNGSPYYNLSLPKDFGGDTLSGLPATGPMLIRSQSNTILLTFEATTIDYNKAKVFKDALKNRTLIPLPPLGPNEEYEYIPAPRYNYATDPAPLGLPTELKNLKIVDYESGYTKENLAMEALSLTCNVDGVNSLVILTRTERNGTSFEGFFLFPYAQKHNYIPLAIFSAKSLLTKK